MKTAIIIGVALFILIVVFVIFRYECVWKYEYILEKGENGEWYEEPILHSCDEPISKEFKELWHERQRQFKKEHKI